MGARHLTQRQHVEAAAEARCNLNTFYAVIAILEGGSITGKQAQETAERIIKLCKTGAAQQLVLYDGHVDVAARGRDALGVSP